MKRCIKCGCELEDAATFCSKCGQRVNMEAAYEPQPTGYQQPQYAGYQQPENLLQQLSKKIKTEAIIWIVVASLQVIIGLWNILIGFAFEDGTTNIISGLLILAVAVANFISSSKDFKYSRSILVQPTGIVAKYSPIGGNISNLVYNLICGGFIGVVGSIYGFIVRNFVVSNEAHFKNIESQYTR